MTDRDSGRSGGNPKVALWCGSAPAVVVDELASIGQEGGHGSASVVAGDIGVEVLPDTFDSVRVRTVGRQEVQDDMAAELLESAQRHCSLVNAVVVEDDVDTSSASIEDRDSSQQVAKQRSVLVGCTGADQLAGEYVQRTGKVELLVLAGREDLSLMTAQHPVTADLRVQMDVDLILEDDGFGGGCAVFQAPQFSQTSQPLVARPRAKHDRIRRTETSAEPSQSATHRADRNVNVPLPLHLQTEQFPRPGRSLPSEIRRRARQNRSQTSQKYVTCFAVAVAGPSVVQPCFTVAQEPGLDSRYAGRCHSQSQTYLSLPEPTSQLRHHKKPKRRLGVSALASHHHQTTSLPAVHPRYPRFRHGVPPWLSLATQRSQESPWLFNPSARFDPESRSVI